MALISLGPLVGQARGSIGGVVFSHSSSGPTARAWSNPVNPASPAQQAVRAAHSSLHSRWVQVLTDAQRVAWNSLATHTTLTNRLGNQFHLSGQQLYVRNNGALATMTRPLVDDAPPFAILPTPTFSFTKTWSVGEYVIWTTIIFSADRTSTTYAAFWQTPFLPQHRYKANGPWSFVELWSFSGASGKSGKLDTTPTCTVDRRIFFKLRFADAAGAVSAPAYAQVTT